MIFNKRRYYFVSYAHKTTKGDGFGNCFFKTKNCHLNIREAEKLIKEANGFEWCGIITINKIHKSQYNN